MPALSLALILQMAANPACTVPGMVQDFWPQVVRQESHYDPLALRDDTDRRSYYPDTVAAAEALVTRLMGQGHTVGVGLSQLTASSQGEFWDKFHLSPLDALEPCRNMQVGARFFVRRALAMYNAGDPDSARGLAYAEKVTAAPLRSISSGVQAAPAPIPMRVNRHASDTEAW